jgi:D-serine deaminase-like pyridoxal phosphate-dependent protein
VSPLAEIETPAVLLDAERLEANLTRMADLCQQHGRALRPHAKSHKTVEIAVRQRDLGAVGVTVAKLGEAEVYADAGIEDVFVCYPIVGAGKLQRLLDLAARIRVSTIVDAGAKALTLDRGVHGLQLLDGFGTIRDRPGVRIGSLSEEHGWLALDAGAAVEIGERLEVIPNHACPVVANFERLVLIQDGEPVERWDVAARGLMV